MGLWISHQPTFIGTKLNAKSKFRVNYQPQSTKKLEERAEDRKQYFIMILSKRTSYSLAVSVFILLYTGLICIPLTVSVFVAILSKIAAYLQIFWVSTSVIFYSVHNY